MCCDDKKMGAKDTAMGGAPGQPVGMEVLPEDFMNPGAGFSSEDVLGSIYSRLGIGEEEEEEEEVAA
jgi:hypothetical protein